MKSRDSYPMRIHLLCIATVLLADLAPGAGEVGGEVLKPRQQIEKPAKTIVRPEMHEATRIRVKFKDDFSIRLRDGEPAAAGDGSEEVSGLIVKLKLAGVTWQRQHRVSEEKLAQMRETAQQNTGKAMPDLNTEFILRLPEGADTAGIIDQLNALGQVEIAEPIQKPAPPPVVGNYEGQQDYLDAATTGVDARVAWTYPGGTGTDVRVADIEYLWNMSHVDYTATLVGPDPVVPIIDGDPLTTDHGTAVLGEMAGKNDSVGVTGIAYGSTFYVATQNTADGNNPAAAITTAAEELREGDVMLLEMQTDGSTAEGWQYVPIEWDAAVYNAIVTAVGNGIIVVEAAGNGSQNLDDPIFNTGHAPFLAENDSGAIIVGAGAPPGHFRADRSRLDFSTYGSRVNVQGWGEMVTTTGYGGLYSADGANKFYTSTFNGTSSASPIVAGSCAVLQGIYKASHPGSVLMPDAMRGILLNSGSSQQDGFHPASENIGPRPNLAAAIPYVKGPTIWVDFSFLAIPPFFTESGSFRRPFNTFAEGVAAVPAGGTVVVKGGHRREPMTVTKAMNVLSYGGPATLGQ